MANSSLDSAIQLASFGSMRNRSSTTFASIDVILTNIMINIGSVSPKLISDL